MDRMDKAFMISSMILGGLIMLILAEVAAKVSEQSICSNHRGEGSYVSKNI